MRRNLFLGIGVVVLLAGLLFLLQGSGLFKGSPMTNEHFWIYAGAVIALIGAALIVAATRIRRT